MIVVLMVLLAANCSHAQYYYTDIVSNKQVIDRNGFAKREENKGCKSNHPGRQRVKKAMVLSAEKKLTGIIPKWKLYTATNETYPSTFKSYFSKIGSVGKNH